MAVSLLHQGIRYESDGNMNYVSCSAPYRVTEAADEAAALSQVVVSIPRTRDGLRLNRVTLNQRLTDTVWQFDAEYVLPALASYDDNTDDDDPQISFSCRPKTITRTTAIGRISVTMAPGVTSLPEITDKLGINIDENGVARGADIEEGELVVTLTYNHKRSKITTSYMRTVAALVGRMNSATFFGFPEGSLRFDGIECSYRDGESSRIPCTYTFTYSPPYSSLTVAPGVTVTKAGWDYLWVYTETKPAGPDEKPTCKPLAYVVDRVMFHNNFATILGINP